MRNRHSDLDRREKKKKKKIGGGEYAQVPSSRAAYAESWEFGE